MEKDKLKIYYLKDKETNYIIAKFELDSIPFSGTCYNAICWDMNDLPIEWQFHCEIYAKSDACTHWYFSGEDYIEEHEIDGYYHLCSNDSFENHIRLMCFVWKLAMDYHLKMNINNRINYDYIKDSYDTKLIDFMLKGYEIIDSNDYEKIIEKISKVF